MEFKIILGKKFSFSASHYLSQHKGKCNNIHGHTWEGKVEIIFLSSEYVYHLLGDRGWIIDFGEIKALVEDFDHSIILNKNEWNDKFSKVEKFDFIRNRIILLDVEPTAENLSFIIRNRIESFLKLKGFKEGEDYKDIIVELYESNSSYIRLERS